MIKKIAIYCGSSSGTNKIYRQKARDLAAELFKRDIGVVFGGGKVGLMGEIADELIMLGGETHGVIPRHLFDKEVAHSSLSKLSIVDSMHTRKAMMENLADGFIAMPGGMGTLDEIAEIFTWSQLKLHHKPMGFYNVNHYFDPLFDFFKKMADEGFLHPAYFANIIQGDQPDTLLDQFQGYQAPDIEKWLDN